MIEPSKSAEHLDGSPAAAHRASNGVEGSAGAEGAVFSSVDPRSGRPLDGFRAAGSTEIAAACVAAARAFADDALGDPTVRAGLLRLVASEMRERSEQIVSLAGAETGLGEVRLRGELERTARQLESFGDLVADGSYVDAYIDLPDPDARPIPRPDIRRMLVPIGPVAMFSAGNFPLAFSVAGGDTASALAVGCPVVVKGHPGHPGTSALVAEIVSGAVASSGLPAGAFALLQSADARVGEELVERPEIAAVAFTGSLTAGRALFDRVSARPTPIPFYGEMGSINPLVVTRAALAARGEQIASGLAAAIAGSAGQLCTKPGLIFIPTGEEGERLQAAVADGVAAAGVQVLLNRNIHAGFERSVSEIGALTARLENHGQSEPARAGGGSADEDRLGADGCLSRAHVFATRASEVAAIRRLREEAFGPAAVIASYESPDELVQALQTIDGQLTATVHAEAEDRSWLGPVLRLLALRAGRLIFNGYPTGVAVTHAMHHGGPYPASTAPGFTSVGMTAVSRFLRPLAWQDVPGELLPPELQDSNPRAIVRRINGHAVLPDSG